MLWRHYTGAGLCTSSWNRREWRAWKCVPTAGWRRRRLEGWKNGRMVRFPNHPVFQPSNLPIFHPSNLPTFQPSNPARALLPSFSSLVLSPPGATTGIGWYLWTHAMACWPGRVAHSSSSLKDSILSIRLKPRTGSDSKASPSRRKRTRPSVQVRGRGNRAQESGNQESGNQG
jgi:hypothetical protein